MDIKEKIKLLSDLQAVAENENIINAITELSSGEEIKETFLQAIDLRIKNLLGEMSQDEGTSQEIDSIRDKVSYLNKTLDSLAESDFMKILYSIHQKLSTNQPQPPPPQPKENQSQPKKQPRPSQYNNNSTLGYL